MSFWRGFALYPGWCRLSPMAIVSWVVRDTPPICAVSTWKLGWITLPDVKMWRSVIMQPAPVCTVAIGFKAYMMRTMYGALVQTCPLMTASEDCGKQFSAIEQFHAFPKFLCHCLPQQTPPRPKSQKASSFVSFAFLNENDYEGS